MRPFFKHSFKLLFQACLSSAFSFFFWATFSLFVGSLFTRVPFLFSRCTLSIHRPTLFCGTLSFFRIPYFFQEPNFLKINWGRGSGLGGLAWPGGPSLACSVRLEPPSQSPQARVPRPEPLGQSAQARAPRPEPPGQSPQARAPSP